MTTLNPEPQQEPRLDAWPVPVQTPRTVISLGRWPRSTKAGAALWICAGMTLAAMTIATATSLETGKWASLLCPAAVALLTLAALLAIGIERRRRHQMLERGEVVLGRIEATQHPLAAPVSAPQHVNLRYSFKTSAGLNREGSAQLPVFGQPEPASLKIGDPLLIIAHPRHLNTQVAPGLFGIRFDPIEDQRPDHVPTSPPASEPPALRKLRISRGRLTIDGAHIRQEIEGLPTRSVPLSPAPSVQVSAWLEQLGRVRVQLQIRNPGTPREEAISLCAVLPQHRVSRQLPILQAPDLPELSPADFDQLWAILQWHLNLHGRPLAGIASPSDQKPASIPRRASVRQARQSGLLLLLGLVEIALAGLFWLVIDFYDPIRAGLRGCNQSDAVDCRELAVIYDNGDGVDVDLKRANALFERACALADAYSCTLLSFRIEEGKLTPGDMDQSLKFARSGCAFGDPHGCFRSGWLIHSDKRHHDALPEAVSAYQMACDSGLDGACRNLGLMILNGEGTPKDPVRSMALFERACATRTVLDACVNMAWQLEQGLGVERDVARAVGIYEDACGKDNPTACNNLGWLALQGGPAPAIKMEMLDGESGQVRPSTVAQDKPKALELFKKSCDLGLPLGCNNEGWMLQMGDGVPEDLERSVELLTRACDQNAEAACASLGWAMEVGKGVEKDDVKAAALYMRGCDLGSPYACHNLGLMVEAGRGGAQKDPDEAARLHEIACSKDVLAGCTSLGALRRDGLGVPKDVKGAEALFERACSGGHGRGCGLLGDLLGVGEQQAGNAGRVKELYGLACAGGEAFYCGR